MANFLELIFALKFLLLTEKIPSETIVISDNNLITFFNLKIFLSRFPSQLETTDSKYFGLCMNIFYKLALVRNIY